MGLFIGNKRRQFVLKYLEVSKEFGDFKKTYALQRTNQEFITVSSH